MMQFVCVRLLCDDTSAVMAFWRDVIGLPLSYSDEAMGYAYFDAGGGGVELFSRAAFAEALGAAPEPAGREAVLSFRVEDVDAAYDRFVAGGAAAVGAPRDRAAWNARTAQIADPEGHLIELYSPLQPQA